MKELKKRNRNYGMVELYMAEIKVTVEVDDPNATVAVTVNPKQSWLDKIGNGVKKVKSWWS